MLKITGGRFRGRNLRALPGDRIRPTGSRARQAILEILGDLQDSRGLDLFCGAGTIGLEAISRGSAHVVFVDRSPTSLAITKANIDTLGVARSARMFRRDLLRGVPVAARAEEPSSWAYLDPPYALFQQAASRERLADLLRELGSGRLLDPDGRVLVEHRSGCFFEPQIPTLDLQEIRTYGSTAVALFRRRTPPPDSPADETNLPL